MRGFFIGGCMNVAFCYSWAYEVIAHKIMRAFKPLEQEGLINCFVPEYDDEGESTIVDAHTSIIMLSRMFLQDKLLVEDAFSCYGRGQLLIPILLENCDFKSIPQMARLKYLPSDGIPLDQQPDQDKAIQEIVDKVRSSLYSGKF
jgi:hypothetical protein